MTADAKRAVFLDRDGVLNEVCVRNGKPHPPDSLKNLRLTPHVDSCLARLRERGFLLIVVTNQPDVARGTQTREAIEEINSFLHNRLPVDEICVCYHDNADHCDCRKPAPGMLFQAAKKYSIDLTRSYIIGDRWSDVEAGRRAKCRTLFINRGYAEKQPEPPASFEGKTLGEAVDWILSQTE